MRLYLMGLLIGVSMSMVAAHTQAQGTACTLDTMRAVVTQACACDTFSSHGQYNKCVRVQLNAFRAQECDTDLIRSVGRCASKSISCCAIFKRFSMYLSSLSLAPSCFFIAYGSLYDKPTFR